MEHLVMNGEGGPVTKLTMSPRAYNPVWSPDGKRILFGRFRESGPGDLFAVNADGTGGETLISAGAFRDPKWSSSGRIAYMGRQVTRAALPAIACASWALTAPGSARSR
jgi:hypothetical protein